MAKVLAKELDIRQYVASLNLNPDNVFYQRIQSNNVSTSGAQWSITSPNKRSVLLSYACVEYEAKIERRQADGVTAQAFDDAGDQISFKPLLPFTNAMTSQTISINGNSLTLSQPRRFSEPFSRMCVSRDQSRTCYETGWWHNSGGAACTNSAGNYASHSYHDEGLDQNEASMKRKLLEASGATVPFGATLNAANSLVISHQEPLIVAPFNPFAVVKGVPSYLPFGNMSPVIPNIDRIEVDIQFNSDKLAAGTMFYRYAHADTVNEVKRLVVTNLDANLLLYWYELPYQMSIPRSVDLQTYNLREFQSPAVTNTNGVIGLRQSVTDLIQLRSVPTFIVLHARRDQNAASYLCESLSSDDNYFGDDSKGSTNDAGLPIDHPNNSIDTMLEIVQLEVILGNRPNVISASFSQRELYQLTLKNCCEGFSVDYVDWRGAYAPNTILTANDGTVGPKPTGLYTAQSPKCFICLRPKDIAEKVSDGVFFPTSLQFIVHARAKEGAAGMTGGDVQQYVLYTHVVVGKHFLRLEPDRAQYQEQSFTIDQAKSDLVSLREKGYQSRM